MTEANHSFGVMRRILPELVAALVPSIAAARPRQPEPGATPEPHGRSHRIAFHEFSHRSERTLYRSDPCQQRDGRRRRREQPALVHSR
jgi:hypothetical protein